MVQVKSFDLLRRIVLRDYPVFSGFALEEYFKAKFAESGKWSRIGAWWDRKGENEIDLIAENELDGHLVVAEVKHDAQRLNMESLKSKFESLSRTVSGLPSPSFTGLSLADM